VRASCAAIADLRDADGPTAGAKRAWFTGRETIAAVIEAYGRGET
jgi:hypothetical protein